MIVFSNGISTTLSEPKKYLMAKRENRGIVNGVTRLTVAVKLIERATSPLAKFVNIFEVVPPGTNEMIIKPTASSGGNLKIIAMRKAIKGKIMIWADKPIKIALGCFTM